MANKERVLATRVSLRVAAGFDAWVAKVNERREAQGFEPLDTAKALRAIVARAIKAEPELLREEGT